MSSVHIIRLREPWEVQSLPDGRMEYRRKFGKPRQRDAAERVWLVCAGVSTVEMNDEAIESACDVTSRLLPRNEVVIVSEAPLGEVQLEIRTPD
jgi:hypothetical protein